MVKIGLFLLTKSFVFCLFHI